MNYETIIIIVLSYSLGVFSVWIKHRCEDKESRCNTNLKSNVEDVVEKDLSQNI